MGFKVFGASVRGPAHQLNGLPNQDAIRVSARGKGWCVAVADGLGSRSLSHVGAQKAVQLVHLLADRHHVTSDDHTNLAFGLSLRTAWLAHFAGQYSAYETTCLWAQVDQRGCGFAGQVGDGLLLLRSRGVFAVLTHQRDGFSNQTMTLAQADPELLRSHQIELVDAGDGLLLMTDGISDDLIPHQLEAFFELIYQRQLSRSRRRMRLWLTGELQNWSTPCHADDKTISGIFKTH